MRAASSWADSQLRPQTFRFSSGHEESAGGGRTAPPPARQQLQGLTDSRAGEVQPEGLTGTGEGGERGSCHEGLIHQKQVTNNWNPFDSLLTYF